jgi:hypothetical protein
MSGYHWAMNALGCSGLCTSRWELDPVTATEHLASFGDIAGRGARHRGVLDGKSDNSYR